MGLAIGEFVFAVLMGDFFYRNNNGQMERAYLIRPLGFKGHEVYIDFEEGIVVHEWDEFGGYRVTPWMRVKNP